MMVIPIILTIFNRFGEKEYKFNLSEPSASALGFEISAEIRPMRVAKFPPFSVSCVDCLITFTDTIDSPRVVVQCRRSVWACA